MTREEFDDLTFHEIGLWWDWMLADLGESTVRPAASESVRMSSKAEIKAFFGARQGGTEIVVSNSGKN